jgi:hypothetical protein
MNAPYQAMENEGLVTLTFGVIRGRLEREVAVQLSFVDGTAVSESLKVLMHVVEVACTKMLILFLEKRPPPNPSY